jgi:hypothetical protein
MAFVAPTSANATRPTVFITTNGVPRTSCVTGSKLDDDGDEGFGSQSVSCHSVSPADES